MTGGRSDDDPPQQSWSARAERAKADGSWYAPGEVPVELPRRVRWRRFGLGFLGTVILWLVATVILDLIRGHPPLTTEAGVDAMIKSALPALFIGFALACPTRKRGR